MNLILYLSEAVIPILVLLIVGNGLMHRQHVYEDFLEGAKSGIRTAVEIMPTLIGLMAAVGILRASGFLDFISGWLGKLMAATGCFLPLQQRDFYWISTKHMVQIRCWDVRHRLCSAAQRPFFIPCRFILCR